MTAAVALVLMAMWAGSAEAAPVRVVGSGSAGGGWLYRDTGTCYVVTARHVVLADGRFISPFISDAAGHVGQGVEVTLPEMVIGGEPVDVARVRVEGDLARHCVDSMGYESLDSTLGRLRFDRSPVYLHKVGVTGGEELIAMEIFAINSDRLRFTVRPIQAEAHPLRGSDSGCPIRMPGDSPLDQGLPLGLLLQDLGKNEALVLRLDLVRRLFGAASGTSSVGAETRSPTRPEIVRWSADTADLNCGPTNLFDDAAPCGWRARPRRGSHTVDLDLNVSETPREIAGVSLTLENGARIEGFEVLVTAEDPHAPDTTWDSARYCAFAPRAPIQSCSFLGRYGRAVRIRILGLDGGVRRLEWR